MNEKEIRKMWTNRNYWILRRGDPWKVMSNKTDKSIADYPKMYYNEELIEKICFAKSDKEVQDLINSINREVIP